jgi:hypothetical protein
LFIKVIQLLPDNTFVVKCRARKSGLVLGEPGKGVVIEVVFVLVNGPGYAGFLVELGDRGPGQGVAIERLAGRRGLAAGGFIVVDIRATFGVVCCAGDPGYTVWICGGSYGFLKELVRAKNSWGLRESYQVDLGKEAVRSPDTYRQQSKRLRLKIALGYHSFYSGPNSKVCCSSPSGCSFHR